MPDRYVLPSYEDCLDELLEAVYSTVGEAIIVANEQSEIVLFNKHVIDVWGHPAENLLGKPLRVLMPESFRAQHDDGMSHYIETGESNVLDKRVDLQALHADGHEFPIQLYIAETRVGNERFFTAAIRDISEIVEAREKLEKIQVELKQANALINEKNEQLSKEIRLDPLTRVLNHTSLKDKLDEEMERAMRFKNPLSILFIDIDNFKQLNDDYGHLYGDSCLRELTELIRDRIIRKIDALGRYGGEEFMLIMPEIDADGAIAAGERLRRVVESHQWQQKPLTVTIGAATTNEMIPVDSLINRADLAMYYGKKHGKNQLVHWDNIQ